MAPDSNAHHWVRNRCARPAGGFCPGLAGQDRCADRWRGPRQGG